MTEAENRVPERLMKVLEALQEKKVEDLKVLDVSKLVTYTDYFIIGTGNNSPHLQALKDAASSVIKVPNVGGFKVEGDQSSNWILVDSGDFVIHLFRPDAREFYALEELWEDAPVIDY